jgi:large subunit ribosomal protein L5
MSSKTKQKKQPELNDYDKKWKNPMKKPYLEKVVLNIGVGSGGEELERAATVLETITERTPKKTLSRKNVKEFNLRKGRPIGVKVTVRNEEAEELLKRLLIVNNNRMKRSSFDDYGNFGFGIKEHISIPGVEYDNTIGIWGLDVIGRIVRPGMRVRYRRAHRAKIPKEHYVSREEAKYFVQKFFNINIVEKIVSEY